MLTAPRNAARSPRASLARSSSPSIVAPALTHLRSRGGRLRRREHTQLKWACLAALLALAVLAPSAWAAGEPSTVSVRVQGLEGATLVPQTQVTTTTVPISAAGNTCSGTSAGGALYDAVHANWVVKYDTFGYEIDGIAGLDFPAFSAESPPDAYWSFWLNSVPASEGACGVELHQGDDIVFFAQCSAIGSDCPSATAPQHFLTLTPPSATVLQAGTPVSVSVASLSTESGSPEGTLPAGVTVSAGALSVTPNAQGVATLVLPAAGSYTLQAHAPNAVVSDPYSVCVHNGNDGNCGTSVAPGVSTPTVAPTTPVAPYKGAFALVAAVAHLLDGHVYSRSSAPRLLAGSIAAHSAVSSVSLELRREYRGRCYAYEGTRERFLPSRCGHGSLFKVSGDSVFSYLLPSALAPGRYVLDVQATDVAGNRTTPARGTSRIVFYVR